MVGKCRAQSLHVLIITTWKVFENVLSKIPESAGKLIMVDGIYSMAGDIAPLPKIIELKNKYGARSWLMMLTLLTF